MAAPNKKISGILKLQIEAGKANPSPPVGPALGQRGINIMEFCKAFNDKTKDKAGFKIPVEITFYADKSFTFVTKEPPMGDLIKKKAGITKGSDNPLKNKVATLNKADIEDIAKQKLPDLNTDDLAQASKIVVGQALSMGINIEG